MSKDSIATETTATPTTPATEPLFESTPNDSISRLQSAIESLPSILPTIPPSLLSSENPAFSLLHDPDISSQISALLRHPDSGTGDNNLCRWFYDTFQSGDPNLQLVVLRFLPTITGLYLSRVSLRKPLAGFEAVLLALYAHETTSRAGQSTTVNIPDLSHPSIYHESKDHVRSNATGLNLAVVSPALEPHGTVRSTRRARIVGVALELYYSKITQMPVGSKIEFCEFCKVWAGENGDETNAGTENPKKEGRIPLPWELLQPVLRILGHCLLGPNQDKQLFNAASAACRSLYTRSLHDINPKAILATGSLIRLGKMALEAKNKIDYTEIPMSNVISL